MQTNAIKKYEDQEVMIITNNGYRYFGHIDAVENNTIYMTTPKDGEIVLTSMAISFIKKTIVRWC